MTAKKAVLERIQRQAAQATQLRHDSLVALVDCGNAHGTWYVAIEWTEGEDLSDFSERRQLSIKEAVDIVKQLAQGLQYLHAKGLVHGGVRPTTILVDEHSETRSVKLLPPLLTRRPREEEWRKAANGSRIGPADYKAPETDGGRADADIRADIFSLGCVFFHLLAGRPPRAAGDSAKRASKDKAADRRDIAELNLDVNEDLADLIRKMLSPNADDRPADPEDLLEDLDDLDLRSPQQKNPPAPSSKEVEALFSNRDLLASLATSSYPEIADRPEKDDRSTFRKGKGKSPADARNLAPTENDTPDDNDDDDDDEDSEKPSTPRKKSEISTYAMPAASAEIDAPENEHDADAEETPASDRSAASFRRIAPPRDEEDDPDDEHRIPPAAERKPARKSKSDAEPAIHQRRPARVVKNLAEPPKSATPKESKPGKPSPDKEPKPQKKGKAEQEAEAEESAAEREKAKKQAEKKKLIYIAIGAVVFLVFGFLITEWIKSMVSTNEPDPDRPAVVQGSAVVPPTGPQPGSGKATDDSPFKVLYQPTQPIDAAALRSECETPWPKTSVPDLGKAPLYRVSRIPFGTPVATKAEKTFQSLRAACEAAPQGQTVVIEIMDNGPLFESPVTLKDRNLVIKGADGYRPLVVCDIPDPLTTDAASALITLNRGSLLVSNLEFAVKCDQALDSLSSFFKVSNGDARFSRCVFSVAGSRANGSAIIAVRFDADAPAKTCRLDLCFGRGANLVAVDASAPTAEIMLDRCLMVGADQPLLQITGGKAAPPTVRCVRTTLVSGKSAVRLRAGTGDSKTPWVNWFGWDSLIGRAAAQPGGVMVSLPAGSDDEGIRWFAANCLYSGWETLMDGAEPIRATQIEVWHQRRQLKEGDLAIGDMHWTNSAEQFNSLLPTRYDPEDTAFAYRSTEQDKPGRIQPLGFPPDGMPPVRLSWLQATYDRVMLPAPDIVNTPPPIDATNDGKYHGERLDLNKLEQNKTDLGSYLRTTQSQKPFADQVVMHLYGTGQVKISPIRLANRQSLVLYFEPSRDPAKQVVLSPTTTSSDVAQEGFFQVDSGTLEVYNATILLTDTVTGNLMRYLFCVASGQLRLQGCRLRGPGPIAPRVTAQIGVGGTDPNIEKKAPICDIQECVLESAKACVHVSGSWARLRIEQSLLVTLDDAVRISPRGKLDSLSMHCLLEHCTVAARRAVLDLDDVPIPVPVSGAPVMPVPVLFQSVSNAFLNPYLPTDGKPPTAGLMLYSPSSVSRGIFVWQGEGDVFDRRLQFYAATIKNVVPVTECDQSPALWTSLWGRLGNRRPLLEVPLSSTLDPSKPRFDSLALPDHPSLKEPFPGADLTRLPGIKK
jgi:serine/threonine-protein kinase